MIFPVPLFLLECNYISLSKSVIHRDIEEIGIQGHLVFGLIL